MTKKEKIVSVLSYGSFYARTLIFFICNVLYEGEKETAQIQIFMYLLLNYAVHAIIELFKNVIFKNIKLHQ